MHTFKKIKMKYYIYYFLCSLLIPTINVAAQKIEPSQAIISIQDLEDFKPLSGNWKVVGNVSFDSIQENAKTSPGAGIW